MIYILDFKDFTLFLTFDAKFPFYLSLKTDQCFKSSKKFKENNKRTLQVLV